MTDNKQTTINIAEVLETSRTSLVAIERLSELGVRWLTIKAIHQLTGLTKAHVRNRALQGKWTRSHDERGRVIIPLFEVREYLEQKHRRRGKVYIIRLTDDELRVAKEVMPNLADRWKPRYDPIKAKKMYDKKKGEKEQWHRTGKVLQ